MPEQYQDDVPWTAKFNPWLTVAIVFVTGGYALMALGIYLAVWVKVRRQRSYSLAMYIVCTVLTILPLLPARFHTTQEIFDWTALAAFVLAPFTLRYEVRRYLKEHQNSDVEMSLLLTFVFGAAYINYCLAIVFSGYGEPHKEVIGLSR